MKLIFSLVSFASKRGYWFCLSVSTRRDRTTKTILSEVKRPGKLSLLTLYMVCPAPLAEITIEWQEPFHTSCMETKDFLVYSLRFLVLFTGFASRIEFYVSMRLTLKGLHMKQWSQGGRKTWCCGLTHVLFLECHVTYDALLHCVATGRVGLCHNWNTSH